MRRRSRSSPPSRRKAAKYWAGRSTSGSKRPASRSCPAEKPRFPFATIFLPPPMGIVRRHLTGDPAPHDYHAPDFPKHTLSMKKRGPRNEQFLSARDQEGKDPLAKSC